jgi:hypothetical protein
MRTANEPQVLIPAPTTFAAVHASITPCELGSNNRESTLWLHPKLRVRTSFRDERALVKEKIAPTGISVLAVHKVTVFNHDKGTINPTV